jgi:hypothetical protein
VAKRQITDQPWHGSAGLVGLDLVLNPLFHIALPSRLVRQPCRTYSPCCWLQSLNKRIPFARHDENEQDCTGCVIANLCATRNMRGQQEFHLFIAICLLDAFVLSPVGLICAALKIKRRCADLCLTLKTPRARPSQMCDVLIL